jgi:hypothetical protein
MMGSSYAGLASCLIEVQAEAFGLPSKLDVANRYGYAFIPEC